MHVPRFSETRLPADLNGGLNFITRSTCEENLALLHCQEDIYVDMCVYIYKVCGIVGSCDPKF